MKSVEFLFDYGSPFSYLADRHGKTSGSTQFVAMVGDSRGLVTQLDG